MLRMAYIDDAISGSAYDDDDSWISVISIVFASHNCVGLQCSAGQNKSLLMIVGFCDD
jgi:hypothetical protein